MLNGLTRVMAALMTGMLAVTTVGACAEDPTPRIRQEPPEGQGWASMSLPNRRAGQPTIFDAIYLCIDRPGSVEITDVSMEYTEGGFVVEAFVTRPMLPPDGKPYPQPKSMDDTLWQVGYQHGRTTVDTVCAESVDAGDIKNMTQVGVQFSKLTDKTARGALVRITYRSGKNTYAYRMGFEVILCETEESNPECVDWDYDWTESPVKVVRTTG